FGLPSSPFIQVADRRELGATAPGRWSRHARAGTGQPGARRGTKGAANHHLGERHHMSTRSRAAAVIGAVVIATTSITGVFASSHREAPLISGDPSADNTDLY